MLENINLSIKIFFSNFLTKSTHAHTHIHIYIHTHTCYELYNALIRINFYC